MYQRSALAICVLSIVVGGVVPAWAGLQDGLVSYFRLDEKRWDRGRGRLRQSSRWHVDRNESVPGARIRRGGPRVRCPGHGGCCRPPGVPDGGHVADGGHDLRMGIYDRPAACLEWPVHLRSYGPAAVQQPDPGLYAGWDQRLEEAGHRRGRHAYQPSGHPGIAVERMVSGGLDVEQWGVCCLRQRCAGSQRRVYGSDGPQYDCELRQRWQ